MGIDKIVLEGGEQRTLVFYLAMEEYIASRKDIDEAMFFWKVPPTVIFGRNQVMSAEVNLRWCEENGVRMFRRKSGGGCVYSDEGNLMISYISSDTEVNKVFDRYLNMLCEALNSLGVNAEVSGRNDVLIDGKKVSGNAFQLLGNKSIVHGTLLYDTDFSTLELALTPSEAKVASKGVPSVKQHVTNLRNELAADCPVKDIDSLAEYLAKQMCDGAVILNDTAVAEISEIEKDYLAPAFIAGHRGNGAMIRNLYVDGVGHLAADIEMVGDVIKSVHLSGDYFALATPEDIDKVLTSVLKGRTLEFDAVRNELLEIDLQKYIPDLTADILTELLVK